MDSVCAVLLILMNWSKAIYSSRPASVCEWSPEGLHDKSVSLIPITDAILKLVKKLTGDKKNVLCNMTDPSKLTNNVFTKV